MMKKIFIIFIMYCAVTSCCKESLNYNSPLIGSWMIESADSVQFFTSSGQFYLIEELDVSGTIEFKQDGTGLFYSNWYALTDFHSDFIWVYDSINQIIDFNFSNGTTIGLISQLADSLISIYFRNYLSIPDYAPYYYNLNLIKQ